MLKFILPAVLAAFAFSTSAAELSFDFAQMTVGQSPTGFVSTVTAEGKPGDWKIIEDEVPSAFAPLSPNAPKTNKRRVLAQVSQDQTDEHFPLLIFGGETFGDFSLTTKFKCVSGEKEQMAGIAFRIQDEKNYYVVRASALGNSFRFYKFVNGMRSAPIGPEVKVTPNTWHEMTISCKGSEIRCSLNGQEIPMMTDHSFAAGKIGFWTKSDSVSYFTDAKMTYTPREPLAQKIIRDMMTNNPRLIGLKLFAHDGNQQMKLLASSNEKEIGQSGTEVEENVVAKDQVYTAKTRQTVTVILPVRDRNGDAIAALHVIMKSFLGQTENNAIARALPLNQELSHRIASAKNLWE
jgi:hypothetical protein